MKKFYLLILFLSNNVFSCELINNQFLFNYTLDANNNILYNIKRIDGEKFNYYNIDEKISPIIGFKLKRHENRKRTQYFINNLYNNFFLEYLYYSNYIFINTSSNKNYKDIDSNLSNVNEISNSLNYVDFIQKIQKSRLHIIGYNKEDIVFKFKLLLDKDYKQCVIFTTEPFSYDFGGMFNNYLLKRGENGK